MKRLKYLISVLLTNSLLSLSQFSQPAHAQAAYGS